MPGEMLVYDSIAQSNIPRGEKSAIRRWFEKTTGLTHFGGARSVARETGLAVRQAGEGGLTGLALGAAHASLKTGLDVKKVPVDAVVAVAGIATGIAMAGEEMAHDARNVGTAGLTVFAFRKGYDLMAEKKLQRGEAPGGTFGPAQKSKIAGEDDEDTSDAVDVGEDPIVAAAKSL
ncbi:MAG: hypothetical protein ACREBG_01870 [Pyrinomonadaceae bacterium]